MCSSALSNRVTGLQGLGFWVSPRRLISSIVADGSLQGFDTLYSVVLYVIGLKVGRVACQDRQSLRPFGFAPLGGLHPDQTTDGLVADTGFARLHSDDSRCVGHSGRGQKSASCGGQQFVGVFVYHFHF
jgi:hypothetical protein